MVLRISTLLFAIFSMVQVAFARTDITVDEYPQSVEIEFYGQFALDFYGALDVPEVLIPGNCSENGCRKTFRQKLFKSLGNTIDCRFVLVDASASCYIDGSIDINNNIVLQFDDTVAEAVNQISDTGFVATDDGVFSIRCQDGACQSDVNGITNLYGQGGYLINNFFGLEVAVQAINSDIAGFYDALDVPVTDFGFVKRINFDNGSEVYCFTSIYSWLPVSEACTFSVKLPGPVVDYPIDVVAVLEGPEAIPVADAVAALGGIIVSNLRRPFTLSCSARTRCELQVQVSN